MKTTIQVSDAVHWRLKTQKEKTGLSSYDAVIQRWVREHLEMLAQGIRRESSREFNASSESSDTNLLLDGRKTTIAISNTVRRRLKVQKEKMRLPNYDAVIQTLARERLGMSTSTLS